MKHLLAGASFTGTSVDLVTFVSSFSFCGDGGGVFGSSAFVFPEKKYNN